MYKEYIQTTYTSQIDKNIIRTENKMKTNYATRDYNSRCNTHFKGSNR